MKWYYLASILFILSANNCLAQCGDAQYPFYWENLKLDPPQKFIAMTANPGAYQAPQGFYLNKYYSGSTALEPITINYYTPKASDKTNHPDCINQGTLDACIDAAFNAWASLCPGQFILQNDGYIDLKGNPTAQPGLWIDWDPNSVSFENARDAGAATVGVLEVNDPQYGYVIHTGDDEAPQILLRDDPDFESQNKVLGTCPQVCFATGMNYYDVCAILLHEIGHTFGLMDLGSTGAPSWMSGSVMWGTINPGCPGPETLTCVDECYFTRLYCPDQQPCALDGVSQAYNPNLSLSVYPNPANGQVTIDYKSSVGPVTLILYSILGTEITFHELRSSVGSDTWSLKDLNAGAYILKAVSPEGFIQRLLIVK